jgi:hypothetical protein
MLTKIETKLIDNYISIYGETFDKATFYQAVANTIPTHRAEELFESDAFTEYLEQLLEDTR